MVVPWSSGGPVVVHGGPWIPKCPPVAGLPRSRNHFLLPVSFIYEYFHIFLMSSLLAS